MTTSHSNLMNSSFLPLHSYNDMKYLCDKNVPLIVISSKEFLIDYKLIINEL